MKRRSLLMAAGALTFQGLSACSSSKTALRVHYLQDSIPVQLVQQFQQQLAMPVSLEFTPIAQLAALYTQLQQWQTPPKQASRWQPLPRSPQHLTADLVTLGDFWLAPAIQQQLIQPLPLETLDQWQQLASIWQQLVRRDRQGLPDPAGEIWAAPYRWGTLMMVYQIEAFEKLGWMPSDWSDLTRSEVQHHLSLPDHARVVIGLALKQLGRSFNQATPPAQLDTQLRRLHQQVKFYSADAYLQPLLLKDIWLAVGWSMDILPLLEGDRRFAAVIPASGTLLTADGWVRPASASPVSIEEPSPTLATQWIDFCWQADAALQLSLLSSGTSPMFIGNSRMPDSLQSNSLKLPEAAILQQSEFLQPLSQATTAQYQRLWNSVRQNTVL